MPEKLMKGNAPNRSTNPKNGMKEGMRQPMALDGKKLNEKKCKKVQATYTNVLNNYGSIRNMVSYPAGTSVEEVPGGKKKVTIGL